MFSNDDLLFLTPENTLSTRSKGGFLRKIFVLALAEPDKPGNRDFLVKIFAAANVNLEKDTLFAEILRTEPVSLTPELKLKQPEHVLVFGFTPAELGLSIEVPLYQPLDFYGTTWLFSEALSLLEPDKNRKGQLWRALQQLFLK